MSRILTGVTVLSDPVTLLPLVLHEGDELPDWADGMVGEHLLAGAGESTEDEPAADAETESPAGVDVVDEKPATKPTRRRTTK